MQQSLEGLGLASSNFIIKDDDGKIINSYWSPSEAIVMPFLEILSYSILLLPFLLLASYVAGRLKGVLATIAILTLPGFLSMAGLWPGFNGIPEDYVISGTGVLGSPYGILPLLILGVLTGWTLLILIYDILNLKKRSKDVYDHFWYASALLAAIFFVVDTGANQRKQQLADMNQETRGASEYLVNEIYRYQKYCDKANSSKSISCQWANDALFKLTSISDFSASMYQSLGPETSHEFYKKSASSVLDDHIMLLRLEIEQYNLQLCPYIETNYGGRTAPISETCRVPPPAFCSGLTDPSDGVLSNTYAIRTVALASECIVPTLVRMKKVQSRLLKQAQQDEKDKHHKWAFFLFFSVIIGGKIANASASALQFDARPPTDRRRIWGLIRKLFQGVVWVLISVLNVTHYLVRKLSVGLSIGASRLTHSALRFTHLFSRIFQNFRR